jgi:hypothetical protein
MASGHPWRTPSLETMITQGVLPGPRRPQTSRLSSP